MLRRSRGREMNSTFTRTIALTGLFAAVASAGCNHGTVGGPFTDVAEPDAAQIGQELGGLGHAGCLWIKGVLHCPRGSAVLGSSTPGTVMALGLSSTQDGFSTLLDAGTSWEHEGRMLPAPEGFNSVTLSSYLEGQALDSISLEQESDGATFELMPLLGLDGGALGYDIEVHNQGHVVAEQGNVGAGSRVVLVFKDAEELLTSPPWIWKYHGMHKWQMIADLAYEGGLRVQLPDGTEVAGDGMLLSPHAADALSEPAPIDQVDVTGTMAAYEISTGAVQP